MLTQGGLTACMHSRWLPACLHEYMHAFYQDLRPQRLG